MTFHILNNSRVEPTLSDWYWCQIYFNSELYNYASLTYNQRKAEACHELGHVWGLADDNTDVRQIMCTGFGRDSSIITPQWQDIYGLGFIYPDINLG